MCWLPCGYPVNYLTDGVLPLCHIASAQGSVVNRRAARLSPLPTIQEAGAHSERRQLGIDETPDGQAVVCRGRLPTGRGLRDPARASIAIKNCPGRAPQLSLTDNGASFNALLHDGGPRVEEYNKNNNKGAAKHGAIAEPNHSFVASLSKRAMFQAALSHVKPSGFGRGSLHEGKYRNMGSLICISSRLRIEPLVNTHFVLQMDYP